MGEPYPTSARFMLFSIGVSVCVGCGPSSYAVKSARSVEAFIAGEAGAGPNHEVRFSDDPGSPLVIHQSRGSAGRIKSSTTIFATGKPSLERFDLFVRDGFPKGEDSVLLFNRPGGTFVVVRVEVSQQFLLDKSGRVLGALNYRDCELSSSDGTSHPLFLVGKPKVIRSTAKDDGTQTPTLHQLAKQLTFGASTIGTMEITCLFPRPANAKDVKLRILGGPLLPLPSASLQPRGDAKSPSAPSPPSAR